MNQLSLIEESIKQLTMVLRNHLPPQPSSGEATAVIRAPFGSSGMAEGLHEVYLRQVDIHRQLSVLIGAIEAY